MDSRLSMTKTSNINQKNKNYIRTTLNINYRCQIKRQIKGYNITHPTYTRKIPTKNAMAFTVARGISIFSTAKDRSMISKTKDFYLLHEKHRI